MDIIPKRLSLQVGKPRKIEVFPKQEVIWKSNNWRVIVYSDGVVEAIADAKGEPTRAKITATSMHGDGLVECDVTIVGWETHKNELKLVNTFEDYIVSKASDKIIATKGTKLFISKDGLKSIEYVGEIPYIQAEQPILETPYGYILKTADHRIFRSTNLINWDFCYQVNHRGLFHMFDYYYNGEDVYLFLGEYTTESNNRHKVYRGILHADGTEEWSTVLEFYSVNENQADNSLFDFCRHIHVVTTDPYTGTVWVNTGDRDLESRWYYSNDLGQTWDLLVMGNQNCRSLSIWFSQDYIYWNTDSANIRQAVWRVSRSNILLKGSMNPRISEGTTKIGIDYLVVNTDGILPVSVGSTYKETEERYLNSENVVIPLNDSTYNYMEMVALLDNGSHWYHCKAQYNGEEIVIMGAASEGSYRDYNARVFLIKELPNKETEVEEVYLVVSETPSQYVSHMQFEPKFQDEEGNIYFGGRLTSHPLYKMKLEKIQPPLTYNWESILMN